MVNEYLKLLRVKQWIKNFFVFVPLLFSKNLFEKNLLIEVLLAFLAFCLVSSLVYVFNDLMDAESDRLHPVKKFRSIASGKISTASAKILALLLSLVGLFLIPLFNFQFLIILFLYIALNFFYTIILKNIVIVDIMCIAAGFMLRVLGGAVVIDVHVSSWLILTTLFISLFLAVMKRRTELEFEINQNESRRVLKDYSVVFINQISAISAAGVIICYALYSVSDRTVEFFQTENLVYTTIFVVFGVFRYMFLVFNKRIGENVVEVFIKDFPMIINSALYVLTIILLIYLEMITK